MVLITAVYKYYGYSWSDRLRLLKVLYEASSVTFVMKREHGVCLITPTSKTTYDVAETTKDRVDTKRQKRDWQQQDGACSGHTSSLTYVSQDKDGARSSRRKSCLVPRGGRGLVSRARLKNQLQICMRKRKPLYIRVLRTSCAAMAFR